LETIYFEVSLPSFISNNEDKIINGDKSIEVGKSINIEKKSTKYVNMTYYGMLTWLVDMTRSVKSRMEVNMNGNDQSIKEVNMMRSHIPIAYVDVT
jgi:hypothetical protein